MHRKSQSGSGVRFMASPFPIQCDRIGLALRVKTADVLLKCDTWVAKKFPVAVHVFQADLAQVWANGKQQEMV